MRFELLNSSNLCTINNNLAIILFGDWAAAEEENTRGGCVLHN